DVGLPLRPGQPLRGPAELAACHRGLSGSPPAQSAPPETANPAHLLPGQQRRERTGPDRVPDPPRPEAGGSGHVARLVRQSEALIRPQITRMKVASQFPVGPASRAGPTHMNPSLPPVLGGIRIDA